MVLQISKREVVHGVLQGAMCFHTNMKPTWFLSAPLHRRLLCNRHIRPIRPNSLLALDMTEYRCRIRGIPQHQGCHLSKFLFDSVEYDCYTVLRAWNSAPKMKQEVCFTEVIIAHER